MSPPFLLDTNTCVAYLRQTTVQPDAPEGIKAIEAELAK